MLDRPFDDEDLPYARERLWSEPGVVDALDALWPLLTPQKLLAELLRSPAAIRSAAGSVLSDVERSLVPRPDHPSRWTVADVPLLDEARRAARRRRLGRQGGAPRARARPAAGDAVRPGGARVDRRRRPRHGRRRDAGRLEPRQRPGPVHRRAGRRRPELGLRARDHRRGPGAVRDGVADGAAPQPDPVDDRGRRRRPDRLAGRRPIVEGDAEPAGRRALARGAADRQLPHPGRDHGGRGRRAGLGRAGRAPAGVGPLRGRPTARDHGRPRRADRGGGPRRPGRPGRARRPGRRPARHHRPRRPGRPPSRPRSARRPRATGPSPSTPSPPCSPSPRPRASSSTG